MKSLRLVAAVAAVVVGGLVVVVPAQAGTPNISAAASANPSATPTASPTPAPGTKTTKVNVTTTQTGPKDGRAQLVSTLVWAKTGKSVVFAGTIDDLCPGDGESAYVQAAFFSEAGTASAFRVEDDRGCTQSALRFSEPRVGAKGTKVFQVQVDVCELKAKTGGGFEANDCVRKTYVNPYAK